MSQSEAVEKLAEIIKKHHIGCDLPIECNTECEKCCARAILEAGYLPVEPVKLEVLGEENMRKICHGVNILADCADCNRPCDAVSQSTIAHNEAKGQLYRMEE